MASRVLIVTARYYADIVDALEAGARAALEAAGCAVDVLEAPGAFEIPSAIARADAATARYDGYVALGCVIRGETSHYDHICTECARAVMDLTLGRGVATNKPLAIGFGVLTVENEAQAWARARADEKDKGGEAARACLAMIELRARLEAGA